MSKARKTFFSFLDQPWPQAACRCALLFRNDSASNRIVAFARWLAVFGALHEFLCSCRESKEVKKSGFWSLSSRKRNLLLGINFPSTAHSPASRAPTSLNDCAMNYPWHVARQFPHVLGMWVMDQTTGMHPRIGEVGLDDAAHLGWNWKGERRAGEQRTRVELRLFHSRRANKRTKAETWFTWRHDCLAGDL